MSRYSCQPCGIVFERGGACPVCSGLLRAAPSAVAACGCPNCGLEFAAERSTCPVCQGPDFRSDGRRPAPASDVGETAVSRLERDALPIVVQRGVRRGILGPSLVTVGLLVGAELVTHFLPGTRVPPGVEEGTRATLSRGVRGAQAPSEPPLVSPEEAERFNRRGVELAKSGDLDGAILQFVQAIAADPQNYKSHNNLGVLYRRRGFIQQAINAYQTASEIEPQDPIPYKNLAILYEEAARAGEALRYYAKYLALAPRAPDARSVKARVADLQDRAGARRLPANVQPASVGSRFSSRTEAG